VQIREPLRDRNSTPSGPDAALFASDALGSRLMKATFFPEAPQNLLYAPGESNSIASSIMNNLPRSDL
jgi:hypothetical protein